MRRNRWRTLPANSEGVRRALKAAVARGDHETARTLTARALELQKLLYGPSAMPERDPPKS